MTYSYVVDCQDGLHADEMARVAGLVAQGKLIVFPTDTVYGIGATVDSPSAIDTLQRLKGRGADKPPPILVPDIHFLESWGQNLPDAAYRLARALWPGALTLVVPLTANLHRSFGKGGTVAVRMPDNPVTLSLLERTGPMAATSANLTGMPPAVCMGEAIESFGPHVAAYLDGGRTRANLPSSIVDVSVSPPRILRLGAMPLETLRECCGEQIEYHQVAATTPRGVASP